MMSDGDDLISYSLIARAYSAAEDLGPGVVLVPKFVFGFGIRYFTVEYFSRGEASMLATVKYPMYPACIFAHRSLFANLSYASVPLSSGYAYEDWHFNCNATALGWQFVAVEGTALFYRQRKGSLLYNADRISARQIPPSRLFTPATFVRLFFGDADASQALLERPLPPTRGSKVLEDPGYRDLIRRANAIDPAVDLGRYHWNCLGHFNNLADTSVGVAYYDACEIVGANTFDAVFLFPGSEPSDSLVNEIGDFAGRHPQARMLVLTDASALGEVDARTILAGAIIVDMTLLSRSLAPDDRDLIALKLLQSCAASASLHCRPSAPARRFLSRYAALLRDWHLTCYRPADRHNDSGGFVFSDPGPFEFISNHLDVIDRIVFFDRKTMERDWLRLPEMREKSELSPSVPAWAA